MRCQEKVSDCLWQPHQPCIKKQPTHNFYAFTCPNCPEPRAHIFSNTCRDDFKDPSDPNAFIKFVCPQDHKNKRYRAGEGICTRCKERVADCTWTPQQLCNLVHTNQVFTCYAHASCAKHGSQSYGVCKQQRDEHTTQHNKEYVKCKACRERFNIDTDPPCITWRSTNSRGQARPR